MGIFSKLFGKGEAPFVAPSTPTQQAVLVHLDGTTLPDAVYREHDLATLEDRLIEAISAASAGEFDGNEIGPDETTLFMYGPSAETLFSAVESVLLAYPLCRNARVEIRRGGPGAPQRELRLPPA